MYLVGRSGTGKTTAIESLALQDIRTSRGLAVIDPHGDLATRLVEQIPPSRTGDLIYLNAADPNLAVGYNPLRRVHKDRIALAASGVLEVLRKVWPEAWGVRMEHLLRQSLFALLEYGDARLPDILRMLTDDSFRREVLARVTNEQVKAFWTGEFLSYSPRYRQEAAHPIQNKIGAFLADPRLLRMFTEVPNDLHFRTIMDSGKILIINLARGLIGEDSSRLLGALLITTLSLAAFSRADVREGERKDFFIYVDEFQNFTTLSVATMISELRKYHVGLILANQNLHQLPMEVRHAVLGNVGTLVSFRVGAEDAPILAREFSPTFSTEDLVGLANHKIYLKLMIDMAPSWPFSAETLRPEDLPH